MGGGREMWDPYAELKKFQLPNGLTVYLGTWDRPWIRMNMVVHAGAKDDPPGKDGVAHFVEHLLSNNVDGWTQKQMVNHLENIGGSADFGGTSYNATVYKCSVPLESDNLKFMLECFGNMLITCNIEQFVERERRVILNECMERFSTPFLAQILAKQRKLFFEGTRLGTFLRPLGRLETIPLITLEEIREFYARCYTPANISVVAVGGIELEQFVSALLASPFGAEKPGNRIPLPEPMLEIKIPAETRFDKSATEFTTQKIHQSSIEILAALAGTTSEGAILRACDTLDTIFFREIRERQGLTYGFNISVNRFPEAYELHITGKFPWENLDTMENLIDECISVASNDTDTINHHIKCAMASYKIVDISGQRVVGASARDLAQQGYIDNLADKMRLAASVTVEQVQDVLRQLRRARRFTMTLRP